MLLTFPLSQTVTPPRTPSHTLERDVLYGRPLNGFFTHAQSIECTANGHAWWNCCKKKGCKVCPACGSGFPRLYRFSTHIGPTERSFPAAVNPRSHPDSDSGLVVPLTAWTLSEAWTTLWIRLQKRSAVAYINWQNKLEFVSSGQLGWPLSWWWPAQCIM